MAIERWLPQEYWSAFKKKRIRNVSELQKEGKIDTPKILELGLPLLAIIGSLTAHDCNTLRPEILMILNLEYVKPKKKFRRSQTAHGTVL